MRENTARGLDGTEPGILERSRGQAGGWWVGWMRQEEEKEEKGPRGPRKSQGNQDNEDQGTCDRNGRFYKTQKLGGGEAKPLSWRDLREEFW